MTRPSDAVHYFLSVFPQGNKGRAPRVLFGGAAFAVVRHKAQLPVGQGCDQLGHKEFDRPRGREQEKMEKMSFSEKLVDGFAVAILFVGLATGVIAKPMNKSPHETTATAHAVAVHWQQNQETRRAVSHS